MWTFHDYLPSLRTGSHGNSDYILASSTPFTPKSDITRISKSVSLYYETDTSDLSVIELDNTVALASRCWRHGLHIKSHFIEWAEVISVLSVSVLVALPLHRPELLVLPVVLLQAGLLFSQLLRQLPHLVCGLLILRTRRVSRWEARSSKKIKIYYNSWVYSLLISYTAARSFLSMLIVTCNFSRIPFEYVIIVNFWQATLLPKRYVVSRKKKVPCSMAIGNRNSCTSVFQKQLRMGTARMK